MRRIVLFVLFIFISGLSEAQTNKYKREQPRRSKQKVEIKGIDYWKLDSDFDVTSARYSSRGRIIRRAGQELDSIPFHSMELEYFYLKGEAGDFVDSLVRVHVLPVLKQKQILPDTPVTREGWLEVFIVTDLTGKIKHLYFRVSKNFKDHFPLEVFHELDKCIRTSKVEKMLGNRQLKLQKITRWIHHRRTYHSKAIYDLES